MKRVLTIDERNALWSTSSDTLNKDMRAVINTNVIRLLKAGLNRVDVYDLVYDVLGDVQDRWSGEGQAEISGVLKNVEGT